MSQEEFERLAHSVFERPANARDRERLEALAARSPELRERLDELEATRGALAGVGLEPLPEALHEALIDVVQRGRPRSRERGSWLSFVTAAIRARPVHALGAAVAAGFAIGAIGLGLLMGGLRWTSDLAPGTTANLPPMQMGLADPATITTTVAHGDARVDLVTRRQPGGWFIVLEGSDKKTRDDLWILPLEEGDPKPRVYLQTPAIVVRLEARGGMRGELALTWDPAAFRLLAVRWEGSDASSFEPAPGRAVLRLPAGAGTELMFAEMDGGAGVVRARLSTADGDTEGTLRLPR